MINRKITYAALALLTLGMASCSQEDDLVPTGRDTPITIASAQVDGLVATRSDEPTYYTGNMWVYTKSATKTDAKYNSEQVKWAVTNGTPTIDATATPTLYTGEQGDQTVWAFSLNMTNYSLPPYFTANVLNLMDILYGKTTLFGAEVKTLTLRHLFTKVTVNITEFGSELSYTPDFKNSLDGDGVWLTGLLSDVKIDHSGVDNPISPADEAEYNGETKCCYIGQNENTGYYQSDALVFPSAENTEVGIRVRVSVDKNPHYLTTTFQPQRTENGVTIYGFEAGYHYTVNLKVGKDKIEVTSVDTGESNPWTGWGENDTELN